MKLNIGAKISLGFLFMLLLVFVLGAISFTSLKSARENIDVVDMANQRLITEMQIENVFKDGVAAIRGYIAYGDEKYFNTMENDMNKTLELENQLMQITKEDAKPEVQKLIDVTIEYKNGLINELSPVIKAYHTELRAGNTEQAQAYFEQTQSIAQSLIPMTDQLSLTIQDLVISNKQIVDETLQSNKVQGAKVITTSLVITGCAIAAGIFITIFLTRNIRKPILEMVTGANKLAAGDFTGDIELSSQDEIGELLKALQQMKANFKDLLLNIQNTSLKLTDAAQQLAAQAQQTSAGASETAATMNEIATTVDNMSQNTQDVSHQATIASEHADHGYRGIEMVTGQMQEISTASGQVSNSVDALGGAINKIDQFVEVITNIADQTNLLALNAAIEAARAGEAGKGFAVVAEEVRKLAEQSAQSTREIKQLIDEIQHQATQAVQAMATSTEKVDQGDRVASEVGQSFASIMHAVQELTDQVQNVAASAEQVSAGVQNVAGTTEEQTAAMEEVSSATDGLNQLAGELNALVLKFKL